MPGYNPDSWLDLLAMIIAGMFIVAAAAVPAWIAARRQRSTHDAVVEVREQVKNNHPTNLRADLDEVKQLVLGVRSLVADQGRDIGGIRQDVGGLRGELRDERGARVDFERRTVAAYRREHPGADPL